MARATAFRLGHRVMPVADGVGSGGTSISACTMPKGAPVTYEPKGPLELSEPASQFCADVLHHLLAITAITAPSQVSYLRLTPNRWTSAVSGIGPLTAESCPAGRYSLSSI